MVWVRRGVAAAIGVLFIWLFGSAVLMLAGVQPLPSGSALGISSADAEALAAPFADLLGRRDQQLSERFVDGVDRSNIDATFEQMRAGVPAAPPKSSRLVRWFATYGSGIRLLGVHEQEYDDRIVRIDTELYRPDAKSDWRLLNFYVRTASKADLVANRFSLSGRPPQVVLVVIATFAALAFTCVTAISCLLLGTVNRRWLWLPFVLVGFVTLRMDLHGAWLLQPVSFQLFSGSMTWSGTAFETWVFGVSLPVGAIAFWMRTFRRKPSSEAAGTWRKPPPSIDAAE